MAKLDFDLSAMVLHDPHSHYKQHVGYLNRVGVINRFYGPQGLPQEDIEIP